LESSIEPWQYIVLLYEVKAGLECGALTVMIWLSLQRQRCSRATTGFYENRANTFESPVALDWLEQQTADDLMTVGVGWFSTKT